MKVIVSSFMRVGSTWLSEATARLMNTNVTPIGFEGHVQGMIIAKPAALEISSQLPDGGVYKTHRATPYDLQNILEDRSVRILSIHRDIKDVLVSLLMYCRHVRGRHGLENEKTFATFAETWKDLSDESFINLLIEARGEYIQKKILEWYLFEHRVHSAHVFHVEYVDVVQKPEWVITKLAQFLELTPTPAELQAVVLATSKEKMREAIDADDKDSNKNFVRTATFGEWKRFLDKVSVRRIDEWVAELKRQNYTRL